MHSKKQIKQITDSIRQFGFTNPLLIDKDSMIPAGHGCLAATELRAQKTVSCVRLEDMSPAQKRAYAPAHNKLALNAGWDEEHLALELNEFLTSAIKRWASPMRSGSKSAPRSSDGGRL